MIGVDETTIYNWERNANSPQVHQLPGVIRFLGYYPYPAAGSLIERLTAVRKTLGLSQKLMAKRLGIDSGTLRTWEKGKRRLSRKLSRIIADFLSSRTGV